MTDRERDTLLAEIRDEVRRLNHLITGNGKPETGLLIRVRDLELTERRRGKVLWTAVTALVGAAAMTAWGWVAGGTKA